MRSKFLLIALGSALAGCQTPGTPDHPGKGLAALNVPVVTSADYVFDAAAPGGALAPGEGERLNGWFQGLGLGYGDSVYVDGSMPSARNQVAMIAGRYGMLVSPGAPVTAGMVPAGSVRVVVARRRASVPGCPNWSQPSQPDWDNKTMSNFGCSVNANLAAQVANPEDLVRGRNASVTDAVTAVRAVDMYRRQVPTGQGGLKETSSKGGK